MAELFAMISNTKNDTDGNVEPSMGKSCLLPLKRLDQDSLLGSKNESSR
jgi:hypothetical protein